MKLKLGETPTQTPTARKPHKNGRKIRGKHRPTMELLSEIVKTHDRLQELLTKLKDKTGAEIKT